MLDAAGARENDLAMPCTVIVGVGENARDHDRACRRGANSELVAICDVIRRSIRTGAPVPVQG